MHEINIHTQRSDKYENKLGSDNIMKRKKTPGSYIRFRSYFKRQFRSVSSIN